MSGFPTGVRPRDGDGGLPTGGDLARLQPQDQEGLGVVPQRHRECRGKTDGRVARRYVDTCTYVTTRRHFEEKMGDD